jgi:hypothetical protein
LSAIDSDAHEQCPAIAGVAAADRYSRAWARAIDWTIAHPELSGGERRRGDRPRAD